MALRLRAIASVELWLFFATCWTFVVSAETKPFPSNDNAEWRCPIRFDTIPPDYKPSPEMLEDAVVNTTLNDLVPMARLLNNSAVILVKRDAHGQPRFKYFGNTAHNEAWETWSSSKVFSAMNGAGHIGTSCGPASGLFNWTTGTYGKTPLGDLVTIIVSYDTTHPPYSSNALGGWFEMVGGRDRALALVQDWLGRRNESLGANYGATPPSDLKFTFEPAGCNIFADTPDNDNFSNTLSTLTMAELVKRIVTARELPHLRFPNTTWDDSRTLLYGERPSVLFPGRRWGGMSNNSDDFLRLGVNMTRVEEKSHGMWRTFSKDGWGYSYIRNAGEAIFNGYACYPDTDGDGGVEYFVSARVSVPGEFNWAVDQAGKNIQAAMTSLNEAILSGVLQ
jgi:hypothetical protein